MAVTGTVASKQPWEIKPYRVDFTEVLAEGETIVSAEAVAYEWDSRDQVSRSLDLVEDYPTTDELRIGLYAAGEALLAEEIPIGTAHTLALLQVVNNLIWEAAADFVVEGSIGWGDGIVWCKATGGLAGHTYKISFRVTTSADLHYEVDLFIPVEEK